MSDTNALAVSSSIVLAVESTVPNAVERASHETSPTGKEDVTAEDRTEDIPSGPSTADAPSKMTDDLPKTDKDKNDTVAPSTNASTVNGQGCSDDDKHVECTVKETDKASKDSHVVDQVKDSETDVGKPNLESAEAGPDAEEATKTGRDPSVLASETEEAQTKEVNSESAPASKAVDKPSDPIPDSKTATPNGPSDSGTGENPSSKNFSGDTDMDVAADVPAPPPSSPKVNDPSVPEGGESKEAGPEESVAVSAKVDADKDADATATAAVTSPEPEPDKGVIAETDGNKSPCGVDSVDPTVNHSGLSGKASPSKRLAHEADSALHEADADANKRPCFNDRETAMV